MKGTEFVLRSLLADGVDHVFMVPGGLVDPFLPALGDVPELRAIVAAQEGGAAYMADGYARASGRYGAALVIGGPGLGNAVTAIATADVDDSPLLVLSGEVAHELEGLGTFQDASPATLDDVDLVKPITHESYSVAATAQLHRALTHSVRRLFSPDTGPVHLSLPRDVQTGEVHVDPEAMADDLRRARPIDVPMAARLWDLLAPVDGSPPANVAILAGHGVVLDGAEEDLARVAEAHAIPVATTQHAKGALAEDHELSLGVFGYAGSPRATEALLGGELDVLVVLGSSLNQRDSMAWSTDLAPRVGTLVVSTSDEPSGFPPGQVLRASGHAGGFLRWLADAPAEETGLLAAGADERRRWVARCGQGDRYHDGATRTDERSPMHPARVIAEARRILPRDTIALPDSGAHRAFLVHHWDAYGPRRFYTAAGLGPMGWGIPAAIGVAAARPGEPVMVVTGDGCMRMHGMEVQTAARYGLPVLFLVINNAALGNVWLRARTEGPVPAELTELPDHDWAAIGRALGVTSERVERPADLGAALDRAAASLGDGQPFLIDARCDRDCPTPVEDFRTAQSHWTYHE